MEAPKTVHAFEKHLDGWLNSLSGPSPKGFDKWSFRMIAQFTVLIVLLIAALVFWPNNFFNPNLINITFTLGSLGLWRFGWWFTHALRAEIFARSKFPKMRAKANKVWQSGWRP